MKYLTYLCALAGLVLVLMSLLFRIPGGFNFSARGIMEFTQTILLLGICLGVASLNQSKH